MTITYLFCGIAVADFTAAYDWYERLFGRPADVFPHDTEAVWRLTSGGAVYVVGDAGRAGSCLMTLAVDDLDAHASRLRANGLSFTEEAQGGAPRRLAIVDEEGNTISLFQDPVPPAG